MPPTTLNSEEPVNSSPPKNFEKFLKNKGAGNLTFPAPFTLPIQETSKVYSGNCLKIN